MCTILCVLQTEQGCALLGVPEKRPVWVFNNLSSHPSYSDVQVLASKYQHELRVWWAGLPMKG
jgi:hypothetical protein